jgi:dTDP-glucose pyrophosphorylase
MKKIKIGVIPAAGKGHRISDLPLTRVLPKPMLPILNRPILEYVFENMKSMGIEDIYLITGHKKGIIQEYFGNGADFGLTLSYITQKIPKGIAHAISLAEKYIDEPFTVILGDDLTIAKSLDNLVETFWRTNSWVIEGIIPESNLETLKRTCCVTLTNGGQIKEIIEKPTIPKSNFRGIGVYLFDPAVFDIIAKTPTSITRGEKEITDTIGLMAKEGKAYGVLINGININVNTCSDLKAATELLLNKLKK